MLRPLALALAALAPLAVAGTTGALAAAGAPAWAPTTGATDTDTGAGTDSEGSTGDDVTGATTETMPPVYEPCGCDSAGEAGGWAALALLFTWGSPYRRRRPTS